MSAMLLTGFRDHCILTKVACWEQITAAGSVAHIITPNLVACGGPSVVHIIDTVLLPFNASSA